MQMLVENKKTDFLDFSGEAFLALISHHDAISEPFASVRHCLAFGKYNVWRVLEHSKYALRAAEWIARKHTGRYQPPCLPESFHDEQISICRKKIDFFWHPSVS
jgi:hypothetical protein